MKTSGAAIVKEYLEKYVFINIFKTKQRKYVDQQLARKSLAVAYDIIHLMEDLIKSNNANDFEVIKKCLRKKVTVIHNELKEKQGFFACLFVQPQLPPDFDKCIHTAWSWLLLYEKQYLQNAPRRSFRE